MATPIGAKRKEARKPLRRTTPLKSVSWLTKRTIKQKPRKPLKHMSNKAKAELKVWLEIKSARMEALRQKFGFVPCERCKKPTRVGSELFAPEGHHNNGKRHGENNSAWNCRILCRVCNQQVENEKTTIVPSLL